MVSLSEFLAFDLPALLTASFAAASCALVGSFLLLRKQSLMGDAISHSVLPGIVVAFMLTGTRGDYFTFVGATCAGLLASLAIEFVRRVGGVESGAAMGVVFSIFFAIGVFLIEQAAARQVDLDADCLLHGQLEAIFWTPPKSFSDWLSVELLGALPSPLILSAVMLVAITLIVVCLYKEFKLTSFDPQLASLLGYSPNSFYVVLMIMSAGAVVASFRAVGPILVVAMLVCPAATARMLTDRLKTQLIVSVAAAVLCCVLGYFAATQLPLLLGGEHSLNAAGMIAAVSGSGLFLAVIFAPRYGVVGRYVRRRALSEQILQEDILGMLFRARELAPTARIKISELPFADLGQRRVAGAVRTLVSGGALWRDADDALSLSEVGLQRAQQLVRSHRLWESYLVRVLNLPLDHVHERATELEHFTTGVVRSELESEVRDERDPHGRVIPK